MVIDIEKGTINGADARYLTDDLCIKAFGKPDASHKMIPDGKVFKYNNLGLFFSFKDGINSKINNMRIVLDNENINVKKYLEVGQLIPNFSGIVTVTDIKKQFSKQQLETMPNNFTEIDLIKFYSNYNSNQVWIAYNDISGIVLFIEIYYK